MYRIEMYQNEDWVLCSNSDDYFAIHKEFNELKESEIGSYRLTEMRVIDDFTTEDLREELSKEWIGVKEHIEEAMNYAWDNKLCLLVYPEGIDLIVAEMEQEEFCYLSRSTAKFYTEAFNTKEEYIQCIKDVLGNRINRR